MGKRVSRIGLVALWLAALLPAGAQAMKLEPKTLKSWDKYVALIEKRIELELNAPAVFAARSDIALLKSGAVQVQRLTTRDGTKAIDVDDGTIHHWLGGVFIPGARVDKLLAWIQDYDQQVRYFKEVEQSRLN